MIGDLLLLVGSCIVAPVAAGACAGLVIGSWLDLRDARRAGPS